jgi:hypothetical protein
MSQRDHQHEQDRRREQAGRDRPRREHRRIAARRQQRAAGSPPSSARARSPAAGRRLALSFANNRRGSRRTPSAVSKLVLLTVYTPMRQQDRRIEHAVRDGQR